MNRRSFFRQGLRELIKPLSQVIAPLQQALDQLEKLDQPARKPLPPSPRPPAQWLRPPGALDEQSFLDTCSRCGVCVNVCPAQCIKIDSTGVKAGGAPYIDPTAMPCIVCDGLVCMRACPTEALVPTALMLIDMGTAAWDESACVRSRGQDCKICIEQCPIGEAALKLRDGKVVVVEDGCIGCGGCEHYCPTSPKAIKVVPRIV